ncbi:DUF726-domain-containing protein [Lophium mytilinum]|uniref:DUF726-domain-containing protein n=1 Tax=Lophium mytilinum TaxID=390894 RepID=A0A6A6R703_9PEZI|nr:DUF726-domain-containing protein [Lophium mytilinum]
MFGKIGNWASNDAPSLKKKEEEASLTSILDTPGLRTELALLVLLCIDSMRNDLASTFDASIPTATGSSPIPSPNAGTGQDLISFDGPEDGTAVAEEHARTQREREVSSAQMQGLRRAALTFFDKWRAGVMQRICDVLGVRGEVVRRAKAKRRAETEAAEKAKRDIDYLNWAEGESTDEAVDNAPAIGTHGYTAIPTILAKLEESKRVFILHCLLLLLLSLEHYPAHSRVLLLHISSSLRLPVAVLADHEKSVAQGLLATAASHMDADKSTKKKASDDAVARRWKVGLATVGGAVLIGVTGGLAAPLLAAGVGTVMGGLGLGATVISGYLGALAGSTVLVGSLFGAYGGKMTGKIMDQYAKEVQDFRFIPIRASYTPASQYRTEEMSLRDSRQQEQHRLRVAIGVSGWLNSESDVTKPWDVLQCSGIEPFALRWELDALLRLGTSLTEVFKSYAWEGAKIEIVRRTLLGALYAGLWPLGLLKMASVLDNPFSVAVSRSDKAGKVLAHALISKVQGERPVTLIGYSLGARVIFSCLLELAEQNAFGLIESVAFLGSPVPSSSSDWRRIRAVVSARVVNVYSKEDYILGFLYRTSKIQLGVAGLQPVKGVHGVQNVDINELITGHNKYRFLIGSILGKIGFEDVDATQIEEQVKALKLVERREEESKMQDKKQNEKPKDHPPWKSTSQEAASRPSLAQSSSSRTVVPTESKMKADPLGATSNSSDDEYGPRNRRITMMDMEEEEAPPFPKRPSTVQPTAAMFKKMEVLTLMPKTDVANNEIESDTESLASLPLAEMCEVEPLPEPEPENERVQFGSSVRGFELTWETR